MKRIKLFLVDDEYKVRQGLRMRLDMEPDFEVIGEAGDGGSALVALNAARPDVVVMDVQMPVLDGIQATAVLRDNLPDCAVVILSMQDDADTRARARNAGAAGFVAKHQINSKLTGAIRAAATRPAGDPSAQHGRDRSSRAGEEQGA